MASFSVSVNDGPEQKIEVKSGLYLHAVAAVPALLDIALPCHVTVWTEFSRFRFHLRYNEFGHLVIEHLVPARSYEAPH